DLIVAIGFIGLIASLIVYDHKFRHVRTLLKNMSFLGDFSYTLYIVHFPILVLISAALIKFNKELPQHHYFVMLGIAIAIGVSILLYHLVEKKFIRFKKA